MGNDTDGKYRPISIGNFSTYNSLSEEDKKNYVIPGKYARIIIEKINKKLKLVDNSIIDLYVAFVVDDKGKKTSKKFVITDNQFTKTIQEEYVNAAGSSVVDARSGGKINNPFTAAYESSR